ncbi:thiamine pyrophosphate enzyme, N-terminal TPP binding domain-containing protein [Hygrophoropsis aurantiaca]|uniref:Thiamine pyrophosphate enzyme, N-terminal TPP binding domain-containing protein n=1 Tax=Hygrophoropsis aurantiaca TaxID=72124 RepID=A0ACB8AK75_9AGAM|nr:thiamine pyrophosphate enzyme, N-terminal TPP binding domain-containing protein [Hygrophoropsis aurantiaca]
MYTTSSLFLRTLVEVGITHAFVNWGSDHPALLEDLERQRVEKGETSLKIVTCPNEMVALSAAQGYAQVTGKPAAVIVHVDVGTQALAGAIHNANRGKAPVLIYAGASPFTMEGELKGSRNEWIMWMQDTHDQPAIVRQYMRYTAQINAPENVPHLVRRALQIATSDPKGPVYLWGRREVMEKEIDPSLMSAPVPLLKWPSVAPSALSPSAASEIAKALVNAENPLIITSHIGRNPSACAELGSLSRELALPIFVTCPSAINIPFSHPNLIGVSFLAPGTNTPLLKDADVILVVDVEVAWIPMNKDSSGAYERPKDSAKVFVLDSGDPLREGIGMNHIDADLVCRADAGIALGQILLLSETIGRQRDSKTLGLAVRQRTEKILQLRQAWLASMEEAEAFPSISPAQTASISYTGPQIVASLRKAISARTFSASGTLYLNESISNYPVTYSHTQPEVPGGMIGSGGSSLGWALGASVGAVIGGQVAKRGDQGTGFDFVTTIVGDGTFLFGVPASAYWMARRYQTPFLTIILNNGGWKSPKLSMLGVYPQGHGSKVLGNQLTVGFGPDMPDYSQIAVAASGGWAWGKRVSAQTVGEGQTLQEALEEAMAEAVRVVVGERRCAVLDCVLESI